MARSFNVSFNITGTLDGSLQAALQNASRAMRGLGESARAASGMASAAQAGLQRLANSLNAIKNAAQQFKSLQDALKQTSTAFSQSGSALDAAKAKMQADAQAAEQLKQKLSQLNGELNRAKTAKVGEQSGLRTLRDQMRQLKQAYAEAKAAGNQVKMTALSSQMSALGASIQTQQSKVRAAAQAYRELSEKVKQAKTDLKAAEQAASSSARGFSQAQANVERLRQSYQNQLSALRQLSASLSQAGFNVSNFASSEARLESEINRVNAALERQRALTDAQRRSQETSQGLFNAYGNFQGALQTAETIAAPFKSAVENAMTFEHAISRVKALTQSQNIREGNTAQVESDMQLLTQQARDLGASTMFTATQAAEAMGYLGMAGWKTQQIYGTMPGMLSLAAAAGADLAQTADIVSDNMTAMGVPVEQASHFMDVYAYALTNSNARLSDFGETMKYAAPVAKAYGATLDETAAMVMMMANAGIKGSMAGTSLRMGLLRLAGPPKTATKEMEKLGLSLSDAQAGALEAEAVIKGLGIDMTGATTAGEKMTRVIMQLHDKTKNLSQDEKLAAFKGIFGVNAETGWLALFDQGPEVFMKYLDGLRNADGYSAQVAETMNDDTRGALIILESAWDAFSERIGEALLPAVRTAAEAFTPMVTAAAQFIEQNPAIVQAAAGIAAAIAGVVVSASAVKLAFAGWEFVTAQVALVRTALASLSSGAMLEGLIGRLAALRTALFGLGGAATLGGWSTMFAAIAARAAAARVAVVSFFASLSLSSMATGAVSALQMIGTAIAGAARAAMAFAFSPIGAALMALALAGLYCYQNWDKVAPVLSNIANIITGALSGALATITPAIQNVMTAFSNLANALGSSGLFSTLGMMITGVLASIATAVAGALATVINTIATIISTVANVLSGIVNLVSSVISGNWSAAWESMKSIATSALQGIADVAKGILDGILSTVEAIGKAWDFLSGGTTVTQEAAAKQAPSSAPTDTVIPQAQPIDTSATQAGLDAVGQAAQTAATQMDGVNTAAQNISQAGDALGNLPAAVQPATQGMSTLGTQAATAATNVGTFGSQAQTAAAGVQSIATNAQTAGTNVGTLGTNAGTASGTVQTLGTNAGTAGVAMSEVPGHAANLNAGLELPIGNLDALGVAAGGAVEGVRSLGSAAGAAAEALRAKASEIAAIHIQVPTVSTVAAPAANAEGGIYRKGAFLTTFAERSPEAAIPIERSKRATDLWTTVGQMLGILPGESKAPWCGTPELSKKLPRIPRGRQGGKVMTPRRHGRNYQEDYNKITPQVQRMSWNIHLPKLPRLTYPPLSTPPTTVDKPAVAPQDRARHYQDAYDKIMPQVSRMPRGLIIPRLNRDIFNPMGTPTFPTPEEDSNGGGILDRLSGLISDGRQAADSGLPSINITLNLTVNGGADVASVRQGTRQGVEDATPTLQRSLAFELRNYKREQLRRSFT